MKYYKNAVTERIKSFKNEKEPTMAICEADGKEYWAYSGIHNETSKPYKNNKKNYRM